MAWYKKAKISSDDLMFYLFAGAFFSMPIGTSPPIICGVLACAVWVFSGKVTKTADTCLRRSWFWPVLLLIFLPWIGLLYTPDLNGLGIKFARKTHYWIYCMAVASISLAIHSPQKLIKAFLYGLAVNSLVAILQLAGLVPAVDIYGVKQYLGFGLGYSTQSAFLIVGMLTASYYFNVSTEKKTRIFFFLLMAGYIFHLVILLGRVGFFTFAILSPLIVRNLFKEFNAFKISLVYVLLLGITFLSPIVRQRVSLSIDQLKHHLTADPDHAWGKEYTEHQDRFYMWYGAVNIFLENPIVGVGTGGYATVLKKRGKPEWPFIAHPHNNFLHMAVSYGAIGIFALSWFFWEIIRNSLAERHTPLGYFILSTALVIFVSGLVDTHILDSGPAFLLAVATGLQNGLAKYAGR
jgi:O-antigen ligase